MSTALQTLIPPDLKWFKEAKFGIFIHWGIYTVNGKDASWSYCRSLPTPQTSTDKAVSAAPIPRSVSNFIASRRCDLIFREKHFEL
jgi:hypothetical protein